MKTVFRTFPVMLAATAIWLPATAQTQTDTLEMERKTYALPELTVKGERPVVKAKGGTLVYDISRIAREQAADNAYEAVKLLPGVAESGGNITLNSRPVTLMIDGKPTNMSAEQMATLLKSMSANRIKNAEVMYVTPARYRQKGQVINITLRHGSAATAMQGEAYAGYRQEHNATFGERLSLLYAKGKLEADMLYSHNHGKNFLYYDNEYRHTLADGSSYSLNTTDKNRKRGHDHFYRTALTYNITPKHILNIAYTGQTTASHSLQRVSGDIRSVLQKDADTQLHDLRVDYTAPFGMTAGIEYTHYKSPDTQHLNSSDLFGESLEYITHDDQNIRKWNAYIQQEHDMGKGWTLNYGLSYTQSHDNSAQEYAGTTTESVDRPADTRSEQAENQLSLHAGTSKSIGERLSLEVSATAEYYHNTAWHEWNIMPTLSATYTFSSRHILQLALESSREYPSYWSVKDFTTYTGGGYAVIKGNPELRPSLENQANLSYIMHGKYVLTAWFGHEKDAFRQLPYQSSEARRMEYRYSNFDFSQSAGLMATLPFGIGEWLKSRITIIGIYQHEKQGTFYDIPFDRRNIYGQARMNIAILPCRHLQINLDGSAHTSAIQGPIDIPAAGRLDASVTCKLMKDKLTLKAYCNDIFETKDEQMHDTFKGQHIINNLHTRRETGITLTYRFGKYKEKKHTPVDTSRFGR